MKKSTFILALLILKSILGNAQTFNDAQLWQKGSLEFNVAKSYSISLQDEARLTNNCSQFSYWYLDVGNVFKLDKDLRMSLDYVFVSKQKEDLHYSYRNQYNLSLTYRKKLFRRFVFYNRILNEGQFVDINTSEKGHLLQDEFLRDKVTLRYRFSKRLTPYIEDELYYRMLRDGHKNPVGLDRDRLYTGLLYDLTKDFRLDMFFLYENNFNQVPHSQNFVYGIGFSKSLF